MEVMKMDKRKAAFRQAISCLPPIRRAAGAAGQAGGIEGLRFRAGRARLRQGPAVGERPLPMAAVTPAELREMPSRAARYSVHSYTEKPAARVSDVIRGGIGWASAAQQRKKTARLSGCAACPQSTAHRAASRARIYRQIARWIGTDEPQPALFLSPPGYGKTTLLREWVRYFSDRGFTAAIADERSEIAALADGVPQLAVGRCTDVMEGCSKWQAAVMLLKTMSPALLALDEITAPEDAKAVSLCTHCGTAVIACAHAAGLDDLRQRPIYRELLALGISSGGYYRKTGRTAGLPHGTMGGDEMLKLIGSVMVFGSCAALGLSARQNLRRRVAAADAMLLALGLIRSEISGRRTPMPEIVGLLTENEQPIIRLVFRAAASRSGAERSVARLPVAQHPAGLPCTGRTGHAGMRHSVRRRKLLRPLRRGRAADRTVAGGAAAGGLAGGSAGGFGKSGKSVPDLRHCARAAGDSGADLSGGKRWMLI